MSRWRVRLVTAVLVFCGLIQWFCSTEAKASQAGNAAGSADVCEAATTLPSVMALHAKSALLRAYDTNCNGTLDQAELIQAELDGYRKLQTVRKPSVASPPPATGVAAKTDGKTPTQPKSSTLATSCGGWTAYPFLRDSYADLSGISPSDCPPDLKKAKGASFSWSRDQIANNTQWSAKGVAGARIMWLGTGGNSIDPYVNYFAVAPLVKFQRVTNSNAKLATQNIDVLSPGISSEMLLDQVLDPSLELYVRTRANANGDFEGNTKSWSGTFELQPIYDPLRIGTNIIVGYTYWTISPLARVQYFSRVANSIDPLFGTSNQVFRAGPAVALDIVPLDGDPVPPLLRNMVINLSYSWYQDFIQTRTYQLFNSTLTYNVTDNFGISLAYEKGKIDETGQNIDLTTLGLTVKY